MNHEVFTFKINEKSYSIRVIKIEDELYFNGEDIALAFGYESAIYAITSNCNLDNIIEHEVINIESKKGTVSVMSYFLPELEVYKLIHSDLKLKSHFQEWIKHEIMPVIKKIPNQKKRSKKEPESETISKLNKELKTILKHNPNKKG